MLAYEHFRPQQFVHQSYDSDSRSVETYPPTTMDSFDFHSSTAYSTIPFSFCDPPAFIEAPIETKYEMMRTASNGSTRRSVHDVPPTLLSSRSADSRSSSTVGSPYSGHVRMVSGPEAYSLTTQSYMPDPTIVCDDGYHPDFVSAHLNADMAFPDSSYKLDPFVDPNMVSDSTENYYQPQQYINSTTFTQAPQQAQSYSQASYSQASSPAPSHSSYAGYNPQAPAETYNPATLKRRMSMSSQESASSPRASISGGEEGTEKGRCPYPDCGRVFKDLKAHRLTHLAERPEKCPIANCEYSQKGFARKYDKNRHTLTHYKGTMVCGFCPGSGSPVEKSFNRADVFKRHLTSVHGVEQNPPNSRKRSPGTSSKKLASYCPDATGKCSTCSITFSNAQDFYEHLDDCVLRVVQQEEPSEAINAQLLSSITMDAAVQDTFDRHMIKTEDDFNPLEDDEDDDDEDMDEDDDEDSSANASGKSALKTAKALGARVIIGGGISKNLKSGKKGMTWSKGGVQLAGKGRKRRKHYPPSWGMSAEKMKMKKRVLCVYDGSRRLLKDDMMLHNEFEVRMRLPDGDNYVTDLDVETLNRADAFHYATEEEKGPWIPEQDFLSDIMAPLDH